MFRPFCWFLFFVRRYLTLHRAGEAGSFRKYAILMIFANPLFVFVIIEIFPPRRPFHNYIIIAPSKTDGEMISYLVDFQSKLWLIPGNSPAEIAFFSKD